MNLAATTLPGHDRECPHPRFFRPTMYGAWVEDPATGRLRPPFAMLGTPRCVQCGRPKPLELNPAAQIRWGLRYLRERYGSPLVKSAPIP